MQQDLSEDPGMCTAKCQLERSPKSHNGWTSAKDEYLVKMQVSRSPFIPTINAITSSQELQWMVQPAVLASMSAPCLRSHPYDPLDTSSLGPLNLTRLGVIQTIGNTHGRSRRNTQLNPDEEERRSLRRERNKLAAAKCRHRRRELTDQLQGVTEELEKEQASLQTEVERLQEEREKLELILASHASVCRLLCDGQPQTLPLTMHPTEACPHPRNPSMVKQEPQEEAQFSLHSEHPTMKPTYHHHLHHSQMEEYCPSADCFSIHSMVGCSPSHVVDLSNPMLSHASLGEQDRASSREEAFPKDLVSKPHPNNSARSLEDGPLALLYSPTLLTL